MMSGFTCQVPSPWGNDNKELFALYRNANAGECPLVVDETTPSCGNSRFGCWTCTVVSKDKSMEAMIDNGEDWMMPMLEFRDFLASTQIQRRKTLSRASTKRFCPNPKKGWKANSRSVQTGILQTSCEDSLKPNSKFAKKGPSQTLS